MGRMKNLWIEMEQAQAERDLEAMEATGSTRKRPIKLWRLPIEFEAPFLERAKNTYGLECVFLYGWSCQSRILPSWWTDTVEDDYNPSAKELEKDARKTGEAAKPFGTRDVEKFQKEEKDRQLRELFGC